MRYNRLDYDQTIPKTTRLHNSTSNNYLLYDRPITSNGNIHLTIKS